MAHYHHQQQQQSIGGVGGTNSNSHQGQNSLNGNLAAAALEGKDAADYDRAKESFLKDLQHFHETKG